MFTCTLKKKLFLGFFTHTAPFSLFLRFTCSLSSLPSSFCSCELYTLLPFACQYSMWGHTEVNSTTGCSQLGSPQANTVDGTLYSTSTSSHTLTLTCFSLSLWLWLFLPTLLSDSVSLSLPLCLCFPYPFLLPSHNLRDRHRETEREAHTRPSVSSCWSLPVVVVE